MTPVYFADTAKADIRTYLANPKDQLQLVGDMAQGLTFLPARHRRCPPEMRFGPLARFFHLAGFTVIFDLIETAGQGQTEQEVWVRHVWPATGLKAAGLFL